MSITPFNEIPDTEIIFEIMQDVIDSIVAVYSDADVTIPARNIIAAGPTVHDCEQLSITFEQMYSGGPGDQAEQPVRCESPRSVVLTVQLVRCIPTPVGRGQAPSPEAMATSTSQLLKDVWLLMDGVMASRAAGYLGALADISVTPPDGAYQAVVANLVVGVP